jgi:hypothetical protein
MAERVWRQADYRRKRGENGSAKFHYERILEQYADTPYASQATEMLKELEGLPAVPPQRFQSLVWLLGSDVEDRPWLKDAPSQE